MKQVKQNTFLAYFLSFLVILVGAVLFGLVYSTGITSGWFCFIPTLCTAIIYRIYKKDATWGMFFYVLVVSLVINYLALLITASILVMNNPLVQGRGYTFIDIFKLAFNASWVDGLFDVILSSCCGGLGATFAFGIVFTLYVLDEKKRLEQHKIEDDSLIDLEKDKNIALMNINEKYNDIIEDVSLLIQEYNKSLDKEMFIKKFKTYKKNIIETLSKNQRDELEKMCLNPIGDDEKDKARLLVLKIMLKINEK